MKLLLVLGDDDSYELLLHHIKPLGFELVRYTHSLKAMDNIDEIDPQAIIISARDFPRHWKTMVQFVRSERPKDTCPIIILRGNNFPVEEESKATHLGVSAIVTEAMDDPSEIDRLQGILGRYIKDDEKRRTPRLNTETWQRLGFTFTRPDNNILVTGEVKDISNGGLSFLPDNPSLLKDIALYIELEECSLRVGESILSPVCSLNRTGRNISMQFVSFPDGEQIILNNYLEHLPLKNKKNTKKNRANVKAS